MAETFGELETSVTLGRRLTDSLRERDTATFIISTKGRTFTRHFGYDDGHFVLPVSDKAVYLTATPMEALTLKALHPGSAMLATDKLPARDTPQAHLEGKTENFLLQGRDKAVMEYARHLPRHCPKVKRLLPLQCQSWHEDGYAIRKKKSGRGYHLGVNPVRGFNAWEAGREVQPDSRYGNGALSWRGTVNRIHSFIGCPYKNSKSLF